LNCHHVSSLSLSRVLKKFANTKKVEVEVQAKAEIKKA
jgi:hypothetical protein